MSRTVISFRFSEGLVARLTERADIEISTGRVRDRNQLVEEVLSAFLDNRAPFGPRAFPAEEPESGSDPDYPILISY